MDAEVIASIRTNGQSYVSYSVSVEPMDAEMIASVRINRRQLHVSLGDCESIALVLAELRRGISFLIRSGLCTVALMTRCRPSISSLDRLDAVNRGAPLQGRGDGGRPPPRRRAATASASPLGATSQQELARYDVRHPRRPGLPSTEIASQALHWGVWPWANAARGGGSGRCGFASSALRVLDEARFDAFAEDHGRTHLAHKAEHAADLETGAVGGETVQDATAGDTTTMVDQRPTCHFPARRRAYGFYLLLGGDRNK